MHGRMLESLDAFSTKAKRQPPAISTDDGELVGVYGGVNTFKDVLPADAVPYTELQPVQHGMILPRHFTFRLASI